MLGYNEQNGTNFGFYANDKVNLLLFLRLLGPIGLIFENKCVLLNQGSNDEKLYVEMGLSACVFWAKLFR